MVGARCTTSVGTRPVTLVLQNQSARTAERRAHAPSRGAKRWLSHAAIARAITSDGKRPAIQARQSSSALGTTANDVRLTDASALRAPWATAKCITRASEQGRTRAKPSRLRLGPMPDRHARSKDASAQGARAATATCIGIVGVGQAILARLSRCAWPSMRARCAVLTDVPRSQRPVASATRTISADRSTATRSAAIQAQPSSKSSTMRTARGPAHNAGNGSPLTPSAGIAMPQEDAAPNARRAGRHWCAVGMQTTGIGSANASATVTRQTSMSLGSETKSGTSATETSASPWPTRTWTRGAHDLRACAFSVGSPARTCGGSTATPASIAGLS